MPRLRRRIGGGLEAIYTEGFPSRKTPLSSGGGVEVWLGIGGNLGDPIRRFQRLRHFLDRRSDLELLESSPVLLNPPFGYLDQPVFANAVLRIRTRLAPLDLLDRLLEIERKFGRRRSFRDAPRTLDIDLLFYGERRIDRPRLQVPHPRWRERISVTWPLERLARRPKIASHPLSVAH
ncbi:2-amino-4-hydroxy-6-hydroxymethyldihydropteridine diphosphokinase [Nitratifractor sp.]